MNKKNNNKMTFLVMGLILIFVIILATFLVKGSLFGHKPDEKYIANLLKTQKQAMLLE